jgi:hypothetical protein
LGLGVGRGVGFGLGFGVGLTLGVVVRLGRIGCQPGSPGRGGQWVGTN